MSEKENKRIVVPIIAMILLLVLVLGATYAYFQSQNGEAIGVPTRIKTETADSLVFEVGDPIEITADMTNFTSGLDNRSGTTFARATLKANSKTNNATANYYVYLDITKNEFKYTTESKTPEILLKVKNGDTEITSGISGLEYKTVTDGKGNQVTGYDITEFSGLLTIANNKEIISTGEEIENWTAEMILVNLNSDQTANGGKELEGMLKIQKEPKNPLLADYIIEQYNNTQGNNGIYNHTSSLANSAGDNSYRYAGANPSNYVCFGTDEATCDNDHLYRIIGVFGNQVKLIKADFATTAQLGATEKGGDYQKSSYPNYKGSLTTIPVYYWSGSRSNEVNSWASSTLNTNALNKNFANSLGTTWMSKIATTNWKVGGNTWANIGTQNAKTAYTNEITNPVTGQTAVNNKIGLMYVSDYMYGASPTYWTYKGNDTAATDYRAAISANWMYSGVHEWTISRSSDTTTSAFRVHSTGNVGSTSVSNSYGVRPSFYLESSVAMTGGSGTAGDPYRVT